MNILCVLDLSKNGNYNQNLVLINAILKSFPSALHFEELIGDLLGSPVSNGTKRTEYSCVL